MNKLDENIIMNIFDFTQNYDVFNIIKLNKFYNNLQNIDYLYEKILYRYHLFERILVGGCGQYLGRTGTLFSLFI